MNELFTNGHMDKRNYARVFDGIMNDGSLSDLDKLKKMFDYTTNGYITHSRHEMELLKAMGDEETALTEQIKTGAMDMARDMFEFCYRHLTGERGRSVWDE